ncbi:unnamed protein product [Heligmosomoides polygyrus]|uniref:Uncharacterized protein n=1 Tax=Heligmosomoides polygyrus TaxID=6339 RepID=A0A183FYF7_HELPZ|nr:unnamed protein product [Heligmosomoides polygyrus]
MRYTIKCLLQVEESKMQRFLFLAMSFYKKTNSINGVDGATAGYGATLVGGKPDDLANTIRSNIFILCESNRIGRRLAWLMTQIKI